MKRTGTDLLAALAMVTALGMAGGSAQAKDLPKWVCEGGSMTSNDSDVVRNLASNLTMDHILHEYRARWDAAYIRQQCDAAAAGQPANIGCLKGRRYWDAIQAMGPSDLRNASRDTLRPHLAKLRGQDDGVRAAHQHCRDLGVSQ